MWKEIKQSIEDIKQLHTGARSGTGFCARLEEQDVHARAAGRWRTRDLMGARFTSNFEVDVSAAARSPPMEADRPVTSFLSELKWATEHPQASWQALRSCCWDLKWAVAVAASAGDLELFRLVRSR
jgi:hypothetical protein